jgi:hypothetical protein
MLNVILAAALVDQKIEVKGHVHLDDVTPCVRHLDVSRDPLGGYDVRAVGPDGQAARFPDVPYRYAQVSLYRDNGQLYVGLDFTNAWATDATGPSFGIACERDHLFYYMLEYHQPGINNPEPFRPGTP